MPQVTSGSTSSKAQLLKSKTENKGKILDLSSDGRALFGLLCLIVDIKYKNKYGKTFEWKDGRGYAMNTSTNDEATE